MAAADHLSSPQFYHGTKAELSPGDLIHPNHTVPMGAGGHGDFVWSTPVKSDAAMYGGNTYQVEPTGLHEPYKMNTVSYRGRNITQQTDDSRWVTMAPMRVTKKV